MRIFQTTFFIIGIIFWLIFGFILAISPEKLLRIKKDEIDKGDKYSYNNLLAYA